MCVLLGSLFSLSLLRCVIRCNSEQVLSGEDEGRTTSPPALYPFLSSHYFHNSWWKFCVFCVVRFTRASCSRVSLRIVVDLSFFVSAAVLHAACRTSKTTPHPNTRTHVRHTCTITIAHTRTIMTTQSTITTRCLRGHRTKRVDVQAGKRNIHLRGTCAIGMG